MQNIISRIGSFLSDVVRRADVIINTEYHLSNVARILLATLFTLLGIAWVVIMVIVAPQPIRDNIDSIVIIALFGTVPIVIGIVIFFSDVFDKIATI